MELTDGPAASADSLVREKTPAGALLLGECSSSAGALCFTNAKLASIQKAEVCCCV